MAQKKNRAPIKNEATNGLKNLRGTVAMARTNDINSATSQFFINLKDNDFLDNSPGNFGYAVFGKVVDGLDTIDRIAKEKHRAAQGPRRRAGHRRGDPVGQAGYTGHLMRALARGQRALRLLAARAARCCCRPSRWSRCASSIRGPARSSCKPA